MTDDLLRGQSFRQCIKDNGNVDPSNCMPPGQIRG